jgi:hypothetical protein
MLNFRSFRRADSGTHRYLVVENVRERRSVGKLTTRKFDMERLNLKKLIDVEGEEQHGVKIRNY